MTLQDASNIAQIVSAVAVVVSLIYVAYELRHNSRELRLSTLQAQADAASGYLMQIGTSERFEALVRRLTPQLGQAEADQLAVTLIMNGVFVQFQAGWEAQLAVRRELGGWWTYQENALASWLTSPVVQAWWARDRNNFSPSFRALVDGKLAGAEGDLQR
jgi:hypothetical protein